MVSVITANWLFFVTFAAIVSIFLLYVKDAVISANRALRQWLLWAVAHAEYELGPEMGELKLAKVYDMFAGRFPWTSGLLPFGRFRRMVDDALKELDVLDIVVVMTKNGKEFRKLEE